jgi:hypothetical protein
VVNPLEQTWVQGCDYAITKVLYFPITEQIHPASSSSPSSIKSTRFLPWLHPYHLAIKDIQPMSIMTLLKIFIRI